MTVTLGPQQIKQIVAKTFEELGVKPGGLKISGTNPGGINPSGINPGEVPDLDENLLVHDGHYVARSYRAGDLMAMWFVDNGFIQFYDAEGNMLRTINLRQEVIERRMAA